MYLRYLTPNLEPYDPLKLAQETEAIVCKGNRRKYTSFYATGVYGGIATGYTVGCCLRCYYCWVDWSRDFPEEYGRFYSPDEVMENLGAVAYKYRVNKLRISGAEPTLGKLHLLELLSLVEASKFRLFILETNGMIFGQDEDYVKEVARFSKVHIRVSLKAGLPEGLRERTGASGESLNLPYQAIEYLLKHRASFHVAAMTDYRIMSSSERELLVQRLVDIHPQLVKNLEEEMIDPYETTEARLRYAKVDLR